MTTAAPFEGRAKYSKGVWSPREGVLRLADGRLTFMKNNGERVFDVPAADAAQNRSPWYLWGTGFSFTSGGRKHSLSFNKLSTGGRSARLATERGGTADGAFSELDDMGNARQLCQAWKQVLAREAGDAGPTQS